MMDSGEQNRVSEALRWAETIAELIAVPRAIVLTPQPPRAARDEQAKRQFAEAYLRRFGERANWIAHLAEQLRCAEAAGKQAGGDTALQPQVERWAHECIGEARAFVREQGPAFETRLGLISSNPAHLYWLRADGEAPWLQHDRLYIDVTDATINDIKELWGFVLWQQERLRNLGLTRKRRRGERGPTKEWAHWIARAREVGIDVAKAEFRRKWEADPQGYEWVEREAQWRRRVVPQIRVRKIG